jgi:SAM-dependent methyltransferase
MSPNVRRVLDNRLRELLGIEDGARPELLCEPQRSWYAYGITTLERGRGLLRTLRSRVGSGFRYLDVGCGHGGTLVAAGELGASRAVGLEINPALASVARSMLAASGARGNIVTGDITDPATVRALEGEFDLITCEDVIEHVNSVPALISNMARLLAPGGVLHVAIPNSNSATFVRSDPHCKMFGIVLLPREVAARCVAESLISSVYDVEEFHPLAYHLERMREVGLSAELLCRRDVPITQEVAWLSREFRGLRDEALAYLSYVSADVPAAPVGLPPVGSAPGMCRPRGRSAIVNECTPVALVAAKLKLRLHCLYLAYRQIPPGVVEKLARAAASRYRSPRPPVHLSSEMRRAIGLSVSSVCERFEGSRREFEEARVAGLTQASRLGEELLTTFGTSVWHVVATRSRRERNR